jgi:predicted GIY-YIG superfamily endonuclease
VDSLVDFQEDEQQEIAMNQEARIKRWIVLVRAFSA